MKKNYIHDNDDVVRWCIHYSDEKEAVKNLITWYSI